MFRSWKGSPNTGRKKAAGYDVLTVESDSFGMVKPLNLTHPVSSRSSRIYPGIVKVLNAWLKQEIGDESFKWSTIFVNHNWPANCD